MLDKNLKLKAFIRENWNPKTFVSTLKLQVVHNHVLLMVNNFAENISQLKADVTGNNNINCTLFAAKGLHLSSLQSTGLAKSLDIIKNFSGS